MIPKDKDYIINDISNTTRIVVVSLLILILSISLFTVYTLLDKPYDIDTITIEELESIIDGIGEYRAKVIYDYLQVNEIESFYELEKLDGIGKETIEKLNENVSLR